MAKSLFVVELEEQVADLTNYYDSVTPKAEQSRVHARLKAECQALETAATSKDYSSANSHAAWIRRLSMDAWSLDDAWLAPLSRIEKALRVLIADVRCPYCNGYLRSVSARQCPECLRDWHDIEDVVTRDEQT